MNAAFEAQKKVAAMSFDDRERMIDIIVPHLQRSPRRTGPHGDGRDQGRPPRSQDSEAHQHALRAGRGSHAQRCTQQHTGLCIIERAPWGVIGMMLPVTHSVPTMASNAINILAAGNTAVFGPHPSGAEGGALRAAALESRDRARAWRSQRADHHRRSQHRSCRADLSIIPRSRCCASPAVRQLPRPRPCPASA